MNCVVSKGKNVEEAINIGLNLLNVKKRDVNIEIIKNNSKSLLWLKREAIVKLTTIEKKELNNKHNTLTDTFLEKASSPNLHVEQRTKPLSVKEEIKESKEVDRIGKVWINNGEIFCKASLSQIPTLTIPPGVNLYKNASLVTEQTILLSDDENYKIEIEEDKIETEWNIHLDEQKLKAFLQIKPGSIINRHVADSEPDSHVTLKLKENKVIINTLTFQDIVRKLEELGVKHGFVQSNMLMATETLEQTTLEIAVGIAPKEGKNGWVELMIPIELDGSLKENEKGKVNFRDIQLIPTVERGKVIAIIHPPVPGVMGYTVRNEPLPAKQTVPVVVVAGRGVTIMEDKLVATEQGRPKIEQRGQYFKVSIMSKLVHQGNVDLSTGNIRFLGDIEVQGEIEQNVKVEAKGDIYIHRAVNMAAVTASGAITTFGSIIGSELIAGKNNMLVIELGQLLENIMVDFDQIVDHLEVLVQAPRFKTSKFSRIGLKPLILILIDQKFKNFITKIKNYIDVVDRGEAYLDDGIWKEIVISLSTLFLSSTKDATSLEYLSLLRKQMHELIKLSQTDVSPDSTLTIPYSLNSSLYCSGNILVLGQGCFNTKAHAGGYLNVHGVVRGGELYGNLGVSLNEVGSESGTITVIGTSREQSIGIKKATEGTILKFGNVKYSLKETVYNVSACLNKNGKVVFEQ